MNQKPANDNPRKLSDDELLYRGIEQVCMIAHMAKVLSEMHQFALTPTGEKTSTEALAELFRCTRAMDTQAILSRVSINIAAAASAKHMVGASLSVSKAAKQITLRGHYGNGQSDWHDLLLSPEVAEQLRDALTQGLAMLPPNPTVQ